jgi:environmental stress-induced protein Ves
VIHTVSLDHVPPQPWRNGGGSTQELLTWPAPADWQVRISVAQIEQDGPFSAYPGVQRWFAVVAGAGVVLRFAAQRTMLTSSSEPFHFDGAASPGCELLGGATQDLNLMVRGHAGKGSMLKVHADNEWLSTAPLRAVFTSGPALLQIDDTDATRLPGGTLAWSDHATRQRWRLCSDDSSAHAWWLAYTAPTPA